MSFNGPLQPTQTLCQQDFTFAGGDSGIIDSAPLGGTIAGGGRSPAGTYQNFNPQTSKIVGIKGKALGTVTAYQNVSVVFVPASIASNLANSTNIQLVSSVNNDTSTYTVYWVNTVYPGNPGLSPC